jgi:hypothetical protein
MVQLQKRRYPVMGVKYERTDLLGNKKEVDYETGKVIYTDRTDLLGNKYREDDSGNKTYERDLEHGKDFFGNEYRENKVTGEREYKENDLFGNTKWKTR